MTDDPRIDVTIQVPGPWLQPRDLNSALPDGYKIDGEGDRISLWFPDGGKASIWARNCPDEFRQVWREACTREPSDTEIAGVNIAHTLVGFTMRGGSMRRAREILQHSRVLIDAGGFGAFVDASGIGHGALDWLDLADSSSEEDGGGPFWAFVSTFGDDDKLWTHGMHILGFRDAVMPRTGHDQKDDFTIRNFLAYSYRSGVKIRDGDDLGDEASPTHTVHLIDDAILPAGNVMHNPFGRYQLETLPADPRREAN